MPLYFNIYLMAGGEGCFGRPAVFYFVLRFHVLFIDVGSTPYSYMGICLFDSWRPIPKWLVLRCTPY